MFWNTSCQVTQGPLDINNFSPAVFSIRERSDSFVIILWIYIFCVVPFCTCMKEYWHQSFSSYFSMCIALYNLTRESVLYLPDYTSEFFVSAREIAQFNCWKGSWKPCRIFKKQTCWLDRYSMTLRCVLWKLHKNFDISMQTAEVVTKNFKLWIQTHYEMVWKLVAPFGRQYIYLRLYCQVIRVFKMFYKSLCYEYWIWENDNASKYIET